MNEQQLKEEIKKLVKQSTIISGYFNGTSFTSNNNVTYPSSVLIKTSEEPSKAFIVKKDDKWLCVNSQNKSLTRTDILTNKRRKRINSEEEIKPFKVLFYVEKTINDIAYIVYYVGGHIKTPKEIYKIPKNNFTTYSSTSNYQLTNLGKNKFNVSLKLKEPDNQFGDYIVQINEKSFKEYSRATENAVNPYVSYSFLGNGNLIGESSINNGTENTIIDNGIFCNYTIDTLSTYPGLPSPLYFNSSGQIVGTPLDANINSYCIGTRETNTITNSTNIKAYLQQKNNIEYFTNNLTFDVYSFEGRFVSSYSRNEATEITNYSYFVSNDIQKTLYKNASILTTFVYPEVSALDIISNYSQKLIGLQYSNSLIKQSITYNYQLHYESNKNTPYKVKTVTYTNNTPIYLSYNNQDILLKIDNVLSISLNLPNNYIPTIGNVTLLTNYNNFNGNINGLRFNFNDKYQELTNANSQIFLNKVVDIYKKNNDGKKYKITGVITAISVSYDSNGDSVSSTFDVNIESIVEETYQPLAIINGVMIVRSDSFLQLLTTITTNIFLDHKHNVFNQDVSDIYDSGIDIFDLIDENTNILNYYEEYKNRLINIIDYISLNLNLINNNIYKADYTNNDSLLADIKTKKIKRCAFHFQIEDNGNIIEQQLKVDDIYSLNNSNAQILHISYHPNV